MKTLLAAFRILAVLALLTGFAYPLVVTGMAAAFFPKQARGSLVVKDGAVIGSDLLAQKFTAPRYFWPRPSAADYATLPSGASNKGPTSEDLRRAVNERRALFGERAPADLLTASGSGLDPHVSPEAARWQMARVAEARGLAVERVSALVDEATQAPQYGVLGEPTVNVFALNRALDALR